MAHARDPQHLELVVLADGRERDPVVDLADLRERARPVVGDDEHAGRALECHEAATAGDALPRVIRAVLHHLLGRDVERHVHGLRPPALDHGATARAPTGPADLRLAFMWTHPLAPAVEQCSAALLHVGVVEAAEAVGVDRGDEREDAAHEIGPAGRDVFVGGGEQRADRERDGVVERHAVGPARLDPVAGVHAARTLTLVVVLLVATAGDVVGEHAAALAVLVVAGEQRHDREALHRGRQVGAHQHAELVRLAFEAQHLALHLLVVLELGLEQLDHLDRRPGRARDRDTGEVVGREHLVDAPVRDRVAGGRPTVAGHHHAVGVADRDDGGAVREVGERARPRRSGARQLVRAHLPEELGERRTGVGTRGKQR